MQTSGTVTKVMPFSARTASMSAWGVKALSASTYPEQREVVFVMIVRVHVIARASSE